jgi:hypothetical protein
MTGFLKFFKAVELAKSENAGIYATATAGLSHSKKTERGARKGEEMPESNMISGV